MKKEFILALLLYSCSHQDYIGEEGYNERYLNGKLYSIYYVHRNTRVGPFMSFYSNGIMANEHIPKTKYDSCCFYDSTGRYIGYVKAYYNSDVHKIYSANSEDFIQYTRGNINSYTLHINTKKYKLKVTKYIIESFEIRNDSVITYGKNDLTMQKSIISIQDLEQ